MALLGSEKKQTCLLLEFSWLLLAVGSFCIQETAAYRGKLFEEFTFFLKEYIQPFKSGQRFYSSGTFTDLGRPTHISSLYVKPEVTRGSAWLVSKQALFHFPFLGSDFDRWQFDHTLLQPSFLIGEHYIIYICHA